jgi:hypothetical protein
MVGVGKRGPGSRLGLVLDAAVAGSGSRGGTGTIDDRPTHGRGRLLRHLPRAPSK